VRARALAAVVSMACAPLAVVACKQILGVSDLQVADAGAGDADAGGPGDDGSAGVGCRTGTAFEQCYTCCALIDGGDIDAFFFGGLYGCACNAANGDCLPDCPSYCAGGSPDDGSSCDLCFFDSFRDGGPGVCRGQVQTSAAANPGAALIYDCLRGCTDPTSTDCSNLATASGCITCCEANYPSETLSYFGGSAHDCACDAGGCSGTCSIYCGAQPSADSPQCTRCAVDALADGGPCHDQEPCQTPGCTNLASCLEACQQDR